jgi:TPR repeat protein
MVGFTFAFDQNVSSAFNISTRILAIFGSTIFSLVVSSAYAGWDEAFQAYTDRRFGDALTLLKPLAIAGDRRAQMVLGDMYYNGLGVPKDLQEARRDYEGAAEKG